MEEFIDMIKKEAKALGYRVELRYKDADFKEFLSVTFVIPREGRTPFRVEYNREENLMSALNFLRYKQKPPTPTDSAPKKAKFGDKNKGQEKLF